MLCPKCNSSNTRIELKQEYRLKPKRSLFVRLLLLPINIVLWIFFFLPKLIISIFKPKKYKLQTKEKKVLICNNCGYVG